MPFTSETASVAGRKGGAVSRRTKDPADTRTKTLAVKISPDEFDFIREKAAKLGMSKVEFIVGAVKAYEGEGSYTEILRENTPDWQWGDEDPDEWNEKGDSKNE